MTYLINKLSEQEERMLLKTYPNLETAYGVLYIERIFQSHGYFTSRSEKDTHFSLENGKRKVFRLTLKKRSEKDILIDLDMGNINEPDFYNMLDKTFELTKDIYIIAKNEDVLFKSAKKNTFSWIRNRFGGIENIKGNLNIHFSTLEKLENKNVWETVSF